MRLINFVMVTETLSGSTSTAELPSEGLTEARDHGAVAMTMRDGSSSETHQAGYHIIQSSGSMRFRRGYPTDPRAELLLSALPADHVTPGDKGAAHLDVIIIAKSTEFLEV
jgi:hypothetical protein